MQPLAKSLPSTYRDRLGREFAILRRIPHALPAEKIVDAVTTGDSFNATDLAHAQSEPFEIERMVLHITSLNSSDEPQADPATGVDEWVQLTIEFSAGSKKVLNKGRATTIVNPETHAWEFTDPITLEASEGWLITVDNYIKAADAAGGVRVEVNFIGSLLILGDVIRS